MSTEVITSKLRRVAAGKPLRVLDLFAGCGGLSLGFLRAGCQSEAAVEINAAAAHSYAANFHRHSAGAQSRMAYPRDMKEDPRILVKELALGEMSDAIDILIGGPPCQAYARIGRAKLGDLADHPEAFRVDPRADLYLRYLHYVDAFKPLGLLMENVPDILNFGGHNVADEIAEVLERKGYVARYTMLNAAHYGVPQMRDRVFLIAYHRELQTPVIFPEPTHWLELPHGYQNTRRVALKHVDLLSVDRYAHPMLPNPTLPPAITAAQAIGDLPPIALRPPKEIRLGRRTFTELARYRAGRPSKFACTMREWPGFKNSDGVYDHITRLLPRDPPIFRRMKPGDEYPEAHRIAMELLHARIARLVLGKKGRIAASRIDELRRSIVPPYPTETFPNRWWKLVADAPSRTLMAHIGKDTYSHIHYDSRQSRVISVREAARLQSFPDGFRFSGGMNAAFTQIGNAVPPLLALALAQQMVRALQAAVTANASPRIAAE
jgi:DNA (cytosine-5)-methyltransferase 1